MRARSSQEASLLISRLIEKLSLVQLKRHHRGRLTFTIEVGQALGIAITFQRAQPYRVVPRSMPTSSTVIGKWKKSNQVNSGSSEKNRKA